MLAAIRQHAKADGWADWTDVYNEWDPQNVPPQFAGQAAQRVVDALVRSGTVECDGGRIRELKRHHGPRGATTMTPDTNETLPKSEVWRRRADIVKQHPSTECYWPTTERECREVASDAEALEQVRAYAESLTVEQADDVVEVCKHILTLLEAR
jgi:hypothetical protein